MAYPATRLVRVIEAALGADLTANPATWVWTDISAYLIVASPTTITRGRSNERSAVGASRCELRLKNTDSRFTPRHPAGAHWPNWRRGTPIRVRVNPGSGLVTRFTGFISEVHPGWPTGRSAWSEVRVIAQGILHRLDQGKTLDSALRRALLRDPIRPVEYWPMEDESGATELGSAMGGLAIHFADMQPASDSTIAGSAPLPSNGTTANWLGWIQPYPAASQWAVRWVMRLPAAPTVKHGLVSWTTEGTVKKWALALSPQVGLDQLVVEGYDAAGTEILGALTFDFAVGALGTGPELYGKQLYFQVDAWQVGGDIQYQAWVKAPGGTTTSYFGSKVGATLGNISQVFHSAYPGLVGGGYTVGHVAVAADRTYASWSDVQAVTGFLSEEAYARFDRICVEERIGRAYDTAATRDSLLGSQPRASALELLRQAEASEDGLLWEDTSGKLMFRSRDKRYNRAVALALDAALGHVKLPFEPVEDDQRLRNDVSVSRIGGGTARQSNVDVRDGTYPDSRSLSLNSDADLPHHAAWRVHTGTVDEMRVSTLPLNFQSSPGLIAAWLAMDIGDWLTVDHLPSQYPPGILGAILEGYTETIGAVAWSAVLNVSPSRPWDAFKVEHARLGRVDTAGSQLAAGVSAGATSLSVRTTSGPLWITTANRSQDFPATKSFSIEVGGWQIPVSAITSPTPTFVGVGASASANAASVTPALPGGIAAGDLLLGFAGNRNDASGITTVPAGWTSLASLNNTVQLFGKIATGSDTAPTVTFSFLAAGDTTTAQIAAFRNVTLTVASLDQLNASAQNIAYPGRGIPAASLVLYLGWKPSTWTSVATIAGATEIGEPSSALGSGMGMVWDYLISTTPAAIQAGSFVVTGGVSAASRGAVVALSGSDIQTFTVTAVPGALTSGTAVRVWKPGVLAL